VADQNDTNEQAEVVLEDEDEASTSNGQKRRGRAARRRRREAAEAAIAKPAESESDVVEETPRKKDAPTRGRRQKERRGLISRFTRPVVNYFKDTMAELRKVTWPTRESALRLSGIVIGVTTISAVALGLYNYLLDIGLGVLLELIK
jgi:preprotein translocase subunit SecE